MQSLTRDHAVVPPFTGLDARTLLAALQEPTLLTTSTGQISDHNPAAGAFFASPFSLVGQQIHRLLPFIPRRSVGGGEPRRWEGRLSTPGAPHRVVEVSRATIEQPGAPAQYVYAVHDISRLTELNWWREQLLYQVAHEIRGALGIVTTAFRSWSKIDVTQMPPEAVEIRAIGSQAIERAERLLEDLLSAGSIRAGCLQVNPRPTAVEDLIAEALAAVEPNLQAWDHQIDVQVATPGPRVMADPGPASRVLVNLLSNACKYSPAGETIVLQVKALETGHVRIAVEDRGPGIAREELPWLFERFYRVKNAEAGGIGLGLAIAKGIVEAHGGTIGLKSELGEGTRVWFTLRQVDRT